MGDGDFRCAWCKRGEADIWRATVSQLLGRATRESSETEDGSREIPAFLVSGLGCGDGRAPRHRHSSVANSSAHLFRQGGLPSNV